MCLSKVINTKNLINDWDMVLVLEVEHWSNKQLFDTAKLWVMIEN